MKTRIPLLLISLLLLGSLVIHAQQKKGFNELSNPGGLMAATDSLVNSMQFVFQAKFGQRSDEIFIVVDSSYAEIQNGNRNNLEGKLSRWTVKRNDKRKTISISFKLKGNVSTADVVILVSEGGNGTATIRQDALAEPSIDNGLQDNRTLNFSFDGNLLDYKQSSIYEGKSHNLR